LENLFGGKAVRKSSFSFCGKNAESAKKFSTEFKKRGKFRSLFFRNSINTGFLQLAQPLRFMFPKIRELDANKNFECLETKK
jgi:hypothetical protein